MHYRSYLLLYFGFIAILFQNVFFLTFFGIIAVASVGISQMPNNRIMERIDVARKDIQLYLDNNDGNTSLGARFEMWKSALEW